MYRYIIGIVTEQDSNNITLECNNVGYQVFVSNPYSYELNSEYKVYLYNHIREDENALYGFKTKEELELFLKLINVKGLGPKMANGFFATGSVKGIVDAINRENILYLTKFPKIGEKIARQIILDLKGKLELFLHAAGFTYLSLEFIYIEPEEVTFDYEKDKEAYENLLSKCNQSK